jgi:hypothetical protein
MDPVSLSFVTNAVGEVIWNVRNAEAGLDLELSVSIAWVKKLFCVNLAKAQDVINE